MQGFGGEVDHCQHESMTGTPHHAGQRAEHPIGERTCKKCVRIFKSGREDFARAPDEPVYGWPADQQNQGEDRGHSRCDDDPMNDES